MIHPPPVTATNLVISHATFQGGGTWVLKIDVVVCIADRTECNPQRREWRKKTGKHNFEKLSTYILLIQVICGLRNLSWVVTSSKHCCPCLFFTLILLRFCWFVGVLLILSTKETLKTGTVVQVWLVLWLNRIFDSQKWIWGLHSVPIVIKLVNQNHESRIDITWKMLRNLFQLALLGK